MEALQGLRVSLDRSLMPLVGLQSKIANALRRRRYGGGLVALLMKRVAKLLPADAFEAEDICALPLQLSSLPA